MLNDPIVLLELVFRGWNEDILRAIANKLMRFPQDLVKSSDSTYSRSERHHGHLFVKLLHSLQRLDALNSTPILDTVTIKLTKHLHLLSRKENWWEFSDHSREIPNSFRSESGSFIVNIFPQGFDNVDQSYSV